ncbi:MAG: hypothetical protein K0S71_806 [Clostridia bacterium]|jgi:hypothetical protein|nr:hypothetical protein [Clostridia bacterium]
MSKSCCNNDVKFFAKPNAGVCDVCHPAENRLSPLESVAMCPPIGEPRLLTLMAPVVFDESGINLCRVVCLDELKDVCQCDTNRTTDILFDGLSKKDLECACKIQLQVVDIDFNFVDPVGGRFSEIRPTKGNPNLSRITLKDIDVTFAVTVLDACCKVTAQGMMTVRYLGDESECGFDPCTNPAAVTLDLYTPYGVSYAPENPCGCNKLVPTINYVGFVSSQNGKKKHCCHEEKACMDFEANNSVQQGISAQALAKVVAQDEDCFAIGLTLYIKSIYFIQYKFQHAGLTIPPKLSPIEDEEDNRCLEFVVGDLLEPSIQPLEVGRDAKTIRDEEDCPKKPSCSCNKCGCNKCGCGGSGSN